ncbi:MAG: metallophosphoesterase family protein [Clostridia bacterium]|nr:metallophosphoesterase family protein [Clostridia bacterium]
MKVILISDMHSNLTCLNAMWEKEKSADMIICLGDLVEFGCDPKGVVDWCKAHDVLCVQGNHDKSLAKYCRENEKPSDINQTTDFAQFNQCMLGEDELAYLENLPEERVMEIDGIVYYFSHIYLEHDMHYDKKSLISHNSAACFEQIWSEKVGDKYLDKPRRIVFGHTHQCVYMGLDSKRAFLNPGSLSYRVLNDGVLKGGSYLVINDGEITPKTVDYSLDREREICQKLPLDDRSKKICEWLF